MPSAPPKHRYLFGLFALKLKHQLQQSAIEGCAVIVQERVESRFDDEAAEFDEAMRALATVHDPLFRTLTSLLRLKPIKRRLAPMIGFQSRQDCSLQLREWFEKISLPARAT